MTFKKGDYVSHPGKPEWGPGIVTEDPLDEKVRVLFVEGGEKLLLLRHARLDSFTGQDARLDRMNVDDPLSAEARLGPQRAREKFLAAYPEGFSSKAYQDDDRKPREAASRMMEELLGEEPMAQLIEAENWERLEYVRSKYWQQPSLLFRVNGKLSQLLSRIRNSQKNLLGLFVTCSTVSERTARGTKRKASGVVLSALLPV